MAIGAPTMLMDDWGEEEWVEEELAYEEDAEEAEEAEEAVAGSIHIQAWEPDTPYMTDLTSAASATEAYEAYLAQREAYRASPSFFLDCSNHLYGRGEAALGRRVLTSALELVPLPLLPRYLLLLPMPLSSRYYFLPRHESLLTTATAPTTQLLDHYE